MRKKYLVFAALIITMVSCFYEGISREEFEVLTLEDKLKAYREEVTSVIERSTWMEDILETYGWEIVPHLVKILKYDKNISFQISVVTLLGCLQSEEIDLRGTEAEGLIWSMYENPKNIDDKRWIGRVLCIINGYGDTELGNIWFDDSLSTDEKIKIFDKNVEEILSKIKKKRKGSGCLP